MSLIISRYYRLIDACGFLQTDVATETDTTVQPLPTDPPTMIPTEAPAPITTEGPLLTNQPTPVVAVPTTSESTTTTNQPTPVVTIPTTSDSTSSSSQRQSDKMAIGFFVLFLCFHGCNFRFL